MATAACASQATPMTLGIRVPDAFDLDGSEKEVDATRYTLLLLKHAGIHAEARDTKLLY
jgi:hypothetical protein